MIGSFVMQDCGDAVTDAANAIELALRDALAERGTASLMVSGGSSPRPVYERLSKTDLDWSKVDIGLVDERWVNPGEAGSNEDFIRETLIQNEAASARLIGLKTPAETVEAGLEEAEARFSDIGLPFDVCVMGMGSDAHTASWFPNSGGLDTALAQDNERTLCAIDATGCEVAGDHPSRISLTLRAVLDAHHIVLFIPGVAKRRVFDAAPSKDLSDAPVQALLRAGPKLHVYASAIS